MLQTTKFETSVSLNIYWCDVSFSINCGFCEYRKTNIIKIFYNGGGIPVVEHEEAKMYVPSLIFCHFLPSFNINDGEEIATGYCNCLGAKPTFSVIPLN